MGQSSQAGIAALTGTAFLAGVDLLIVNVALYEIGRDFASPRVVQLSRIPSVYAAVLTALLVPTGRRAKRYEQKGWFVGGLGVAACAATRMERVSLAATPHDIATAAH